MPTETFTLEDFESALPRDKEGKRLWLPLGPQHGEYCYSIPVHHPKFPEREPEVEIFVRSSVDLSGVCGSTGEDSIRVTLVDAINRKPLAAKDAKPQRWVARTKNWRQNLTDLLRWNFKVACLLGTCPACKVHDTHLYRVKKQGANHGRLFVRCDCGKYFVWVPEPKEEKNGKAKSRKDGQPAISGQV